jgi:hypothetical protein
MAFTMKRAWLLFTVLLLAACSHGRSPSAPSAADPSTTGRVVVVRNDNLFDWWFSVKVTLNEAVVAHIRAGEHVAFNVPAGLHTVGTSDRGISVVVEPHRSYYFLISADESQAGFGIERLDPMRGREWFIKTKPVP